MTTMNLKTLNDFVAVNPIKRPVAVAQNTDKRLSVGEKFSNNLVEAAVMFNGPDHLLSGDKVYFTNDIYNYPGLRNIMSLNGQEFVLIPKSLIVLRTDKVAKE